MKNTELFRLMSFVDEKYITEAADMSRFKKKRFGIKGVLLIAATATLLAAALVLPFMMRDVGEKLPSYDFSAPEYESFELDGTTLVSYKGEAVDTLVIPEGIEKIAHHAFLSSENASKIKVISLSSTVKDVDYDAFAGCFSLESLEFSENSDFIERDGLILSANGETVFKYTDTESKSFTIPDGVKYIAAHAFQMSHLEEVVFPEGLLYIGFNAFAGLPLKAIDLPDSVMELADGAFSGCFRAVDGSFPENMKISETSFNLVPFYQSMLAGAPCPGEDFVRGSVTIEEAFRKSNGENITSQFEDVLEYYSTGIIPEDTFCYGGITEGQEKPEGAIIPSIDSLDFASLELKTNDWNAKSVVDVIIPCEGGYDMLIGYRLYEILECLYWNEVRWRVSVITFIPNDAEGSADSTMGEWFIEFGKEGEAYKTITFTNKEGVSIYEHRFPSDVEYRMTLSPDGNSFLIEYMSAGVWNFFIEDLTGKLYNTWWSYDAPCVPYLGKGDGKYIAHSAEWNTDPETMAKYPIRAKNEKGEFLMDYSTGEILRDDMYIYYDIYYVDYELKFESTQRIYDGSDKYVENLRLNYWFAEGDAEGNIVKEEYSKASYGFIYKTPHTWDMGAFDTERSENNHRAEFVGKIIKIPEEYEKMTYENHFGWTEFKFDEDSLMHYDGDGKYIKKWSVISGREMTGGALRRIYYVEIITPDNYLTQIYFYSWYDGDSDDYFERVLVPVIESVRICEAVKVEGLSAEKTADGQFMTVKFSDGEEEYSGTVDLGGIVDITSYTYEDKIEYDLSKGYYDFLGMYDFGIVKFEGEYYLTFSGVFVDKFDFKLTDGKFIPLE